MTAGAMGVVTGIVLGNSSVTLLARILSVNGQPATVASIAGITWNIRDRRPRLRLIPATGIRQRSYSIRSSKTIQSVGTKTTRTISDRMGSMATTFWLSSTATTSP
jgi:hypothetical protein